MSTLTNFVYNKIFPTHTNTPYRDVGYAMLNLDMESRSIW